MVPAKVKNVCFADGISLGRGSRYASKTVFVDLRACRFGTIAFAAIIVRLMPRMSTGFMKRLQLNRAAPGNNALGTIFKITDGLMH